MNKAIKNILIITAGIAIGAAAVYLYYSRTEGRTNSYRDNETEEYDEDVIQENEYIEGDYEEDGINYDTVRNLREFLNAIGNNKTIYIKDSINITRDLEDLLSVYEFKFIKTDYNSSEYLNLAYESEYFSLYYNDEIHKNLVKKTTEYEKEKFELRIKNTLNLSILGDADSLSKIITENNNSAVLRFEKNINLILQNLRIYHHLPVQEECGVFAPVLLFNEDQDVKVLNCDLNGCGTEGINAGKVNSLYIADTKIHLCTGYALSLHDVDDCDFINGSIVNNQLYTIFSLENTNFEIRDSKIKNNTGNNYNGFMDVMNTDDKETDIKFFDCMIKNNKDFTLKQEYHSMFDKSCYINFSDFEVEE